MWIDGYKSAIVLRDQLAGLISAVDSLKSISYSQLQFYNWYIVQVMKVKFIKLGYTIEELDGFIDNKIEVPGLINYAQAYIESEIVEALEVNRAILIKALKVKDQQYINKNQIIKEYRVIFYYTKIFANLDLIAT